MTKALAVPIAVKAMLAAALGRVAVEGLDGADAAPDRVGPAGRVIVEAGTPGRPEIDLCPRNYNYAHEIPLTVDAPPGNGLTAAQAVDAILDGIATAIVANRTLGGLVDYLDASAADSVDDYVDGAGVSRTATVMLTAFYSTLSPI